MAVAAVAHPARTAPCQAACPVEEHSVGNPAGLARMLTVINEFLRSPHMHARLAAFLSAAGHPHPGYDAGLLIDDVSFTALRPRQLTSHDCASTEDAVPWASVRSPSDGAAPRRTPRHAATTRGSGSIDRPGRLLNPETDLSRPAEGGIYGIIDLGASVSPTDDSVVPIQRGQ